MRDRWYALPEKDIVMLQLETLDTGVVETAGVTDRL